MTMDSLVVSQKIRESYDSLSEAPRKVADYLLAHADEAAFLTVERLGEAAGVSPATVTRFAMQVGFAGYPDLQKAVRQSVRRRLAPPGRLHLQPSTDIFAHAFETEIHALKQARHLNPPVLLKQAAQLILGARLVHVVGMRTSYPVALHIASVLQQALGNARLIASHGGSLGDELVPMESSDLLLAISFPRYASIIPEIAQYAREKGLKILALTDSQSSPIARLADLILQTPFESASFFNANTGAITVANVVLAGVIGERRAQTAARLTAVEETVQRFRGLTEL
jgi:DNA-binding MurR/RpiR family transcriptional regulator